MVQQLLKETTREGAKATLFQGQLSACIQHPCGTLCLAHLRDVLELNAQPAKKGMLFTFSINTSVEGGKAHHLSRQTLPSLGISFHYEISPPRMLFLAR